MKRAISIIAACLIGICTQAQIHGSIFGGPDLISIKGYNVTPVGPSIGASLSFLPHRIASVGVEVDALWYKKLSKSVNDIVLGQGREIYISMPVDLGYQFDSGLKPFFEVLPYMMVSENNQHEEFPILHLSDYGMSDTLGAYAGAGVEIGKEVAARCLILKEVTTGNGPLLFKVGAVYRF